MKSRVHKNSAVIISRSFRGISASPIAGIRLTARKERYAMIAVLVWAGR
jgi:hypothetical protein